MNTAIAIIIFNRPDVTRRVVDVVANVRPKKLFVIADGPRLWKAGEADSCAAARSVIDSVDWDCEVLKNYSDVNLGVGNRPASGLRWVFDQADAAIVLEDDCVPHPTFFRYCDELLDRYRDDERVMHISGDNWQFGRRSSSYYFSCYCYSCGWATWRRAFQHYDPELRLWPSLRGSPWLLDILGDPQAVDFWGRRFDMIRESGVNKHGWDWPWLFACWAHRGLSILPSSNLITNIGFGDDATHTKSLVDERAHVPLEAMTFPMVHPPAMIRDVEADRRIFAQVAWPPEPQDLYHRLRRRFTAALPMPLRRTLALLRSS